MSERDANEVEALRNALKKGASEGIECARGESPGWLDAEGVRALTAPFLAAFLIAAALLRQQVTATSFDLWALLLRTAALAFTLRALILLGRIARRIAKQREAPAHALAWSAHGLLWTSPEGELFVARKDAVQAFVLQSRTRFGARENPPLYLVLSPVTGRTHLEIPPYFSGQSSVLLARLERAFGLDEEREPRTLSAPPQAVSAEKRYEEAAQGKHGPRDIVIPEGRGYLWRGPYTSLLGIPFALDALRVAGAQRALLLGPALLACVLALLVPALYLGLAKRRSRARLGIALLLAREELIVRGPRGAVSLTWNQLSSADVIAKDVWSPFVGSYTAKQLVVRGRDGSSIAFDAGFLGTPPEVVAALCQAFANGAFED